MYFLAQLYKFGNGVKKDIEFAHVLANQAFIRGNLYGLIFLARAYEDGDMITPKNRNKAINLYTLAANHNIPLAYDMLGRINCETIIQSNSSIMPDYIAAIEYYTKAANLGSFFAKNSLAEMFEKGQGFEKNYKAATWLYFDARDNAGASKTLQRFILSNKAPVKEKIKIILDPLLSAVINANKTLKMYKEAQIYHQIRELRRSLTEYTLLPPELVKYICDLAKADIPRWAKGPNA